MQNVYSFPNNLEKAQLVKYYSSRIHNLLPLLINLYSWICIDWFHMIFVFLKVMQRTGIEGDQAILLLEDHQFFDAVFLELINSLLSAGEIPGLYTPEELEPLLTPLKDEASQDGFRGTLFSYFASRVSKNLHVVLSMDYSSSAFIANCESNPSFFKSCTFKWMNGWSRESMLQGMRYYLEIP